MPHKTPRTTQPLHSTPNNDNGQNKTAPTQTLTLTCHKPPTHHTPRHKNNEQRTTLTTQTNQNKNRTLEQLEEKGVDVDLLPEEDEWSARIKERARVRAS
jgi:hypothetical protein